MESLRQMVQLSRHRPLIEYDDVGVVVSVTHSTFSSVLKATPFATEIF